jgi:hypothetical protein
MHGPVVVAWILTVVFLLITFPCVHRLVRLDYTRFDPALRANDLAELMLALAMVAMLSPVGGPIPAAGWQAVFALTTGWFAVSWWRCRGEKTDCRRHSAHHALSAAVMYAMLTVMPHGHDAHGPWLNMSTMEVPAGAGWAVVAVAAAAYFAVDAARWAVRAVRLADNGQVPPGFASRAVSRSVMGLGMGYMLVVSL